MIGYTVQTEGLEGSDMMTNYCEDDCPADIAEEIKRWLKNKQ